MSTVPQVNFGSYTSLFAFQNNTSESTNPPTTGGNSTPSTMTGYMPTGTMNNGYPYYNYSYGMYPSNYSMTNSTIDSTTPAMNNMMNYFNNMMNYFNTMQSVSTPTTTPNPVCLFYSFLKR